MKLTKFSYNLKLNISKWPNNEPLPGSSHSSSLHPLLPCKRPVASWDQRSLALPFQVRCLKSNRRTNYNLHPRFYWIFSIENLISTYRPTTIYPKIFIIYDILNHDRYRQTDHYSTLLTCLLYNQFCLSVPRALDENGGVRPSFSVLESGLDETIDGQIQLLQMSSSLLDALPDGRRTLRSEKNNLRTV